MKRFFLFTCTMFCILSLSAQNHRTKVPALAKYNGTSIEDNMNLLLNEVISLDFSECLHSSTIPSITKRDTVWIRDVKNPSKIKIGRDFNISSRSARIDDLNGKEFLVKDVTKKIEGEYYRTFYSKVEGFLSLQFHIKYHF